MEALTAIAIAEGAITILEKVSPAIKAMVKSGQISVEDQKKLNAKIDALRQGAFSGPEWQVD